jgi:hypothetical protein
MATERMLVAHPRQERFYGGEDGIDHGGLERAHDVGDLHLVIDCVGSTRYENRATTTTGGWSCQRLSARVLRRA